MAQPPNHNLDWKWCLPLARFLVNKGSSLRMESNPEATGRTKEAFDDFRFYLSNPRMPKAALIANRDQVKQMNPSDGLLLWRDGPVTTKQKPPVAPLVTKDQADTAQLWAVRTEDVAYAEERCAFGKSLESGVIKHTNLTGGLPAFCGGELIFIDESTIVVNGNSGRYGPRGSDEMRLVAQAFAKSGYKVWSMGFDHEADLPAPFIGSYPEWIPA